MGTPGDKYEREAERVAMRVMQTVGSHDENSPQTTHAERLRIRELRPTIGHASQDSVARQGERPDQARAASQGLSTYIARLPGAGKPLPRIERHFLESQLSHDFSHVRIHSNTRARQMARSINAKAFTAGSNIVINASDPSLSTSRDRRLLAHELTP